MKYEGTWKQGKMNGRGSFYWPNGARYIGEWANNMRQGFGKFRDSKGKEIYEGMWENGKYDGEGRVKKYKNRKGKWGKWKVGIFRNGQFVKLKNNKITD